MARVNVDSYAFDDPRFALLAQAVRHLRDRDHALGKCLRIWHQCASRSTDRLRPVELAVCLGYRKPVEDAEDAAAAFCDVAGLGERAGNEVRIKGTAGRTDYMERAAETLEDQIREHVREHGPLKRAELKRGLGIGDKGKSSFYNAVTRLVRAGELSESDGRLSLSTETSREFQVDVQGNPETSTGRDTLVPDPAPDRPPAGETARAASSTETSMDVHGDASTDVHDSGGDRRDAAFALHNRHDEIGDKVAKAQGKRWRSVGTAGPGRWVERLRDGATVDDCEHVLAILAAEADERARLGATDPLRYLRTPTTPGIWERAIGVPDEAAAREQARAARGSGSHRGQRGQQLLSAPVFDFDEGAA